jgi:circadian clock protein KaiB
MPNRARYKFCLYVADGASNSLLALANLRAFCDEHLPQRSEISVVDVFKQPERALADSVMMTPMLIKLAPGPVVRVVGTLSNAEAVLRALGLQARAA